MMRGSRPWDAGRKPGHLPGTNWLLLAAAGVLTSLVTSLYERNLGSCGPLVAPSPDALLNASAAGSLWFPPGPPFLSDPLPPRAVVPGGLARPHVPFKEQSQTIPIFIIALDEPKARWNVRRLAFVLSARGFTNVQWWNATDAVGGLYNSNKIFFTTKTRYAPNAKIYGVRDSFRRLLLHAWDTGIEKFIVLQDHVTPHCELGERLERVLTEPTCASWGSLVKPHKRRLGSMMLGAMCTYMMGRIDTLPQPGTCYQPKWERGITKGEFATLFQRGTIPGMLRWMQHSHMPFEDIFYKMAQKHFTMPVVFPPLFVPDMSKDEEEDPGELEARMARFNFNRTQFCGWPSDYNQDAAPWEVRGAVSEVPRAAEDRAERLQQLMASLQHYNHSHPVATMPTVIISVDPSGHRVANLRRLLLAQGMTNVAVWKGTDGSKIWRTRTDWGWSRATNLPVKELERLQSFRDVLKGARFAQLDRVLVLEDHAVPHCNLKEKLAEAMHDPQCGGHTLGSNVYPDERPVSDSGGVLLLGAAEYSSWPEMFDEDLGKCYPAGKKTLGSFAGIFALRKIPYILRWMEEVERPFGTMWNDLNDNSIHVSVMYPNLFTSTHLERREAMSMKVNETQYCG